MPQFLMTYRGPKGYERTPESTSEWRAWFDAMAEHLVELGQPVRGAVRVGNCAQESTELGGFSVIEAASLDAAVAVAQRCPHLTRHGGVELGELVPVPSAD